MNSVTTIQLNKDTREELRELGRKGETYDELIHRLIEMARKLEFFEDIDRILETEEFVPLEEI
jgi:predicted CopG family antitoxin